MKKYRFSFPKSAFLIYALIILAAAVAIVFAILRLVGVGSYVSVYPAMDIVTIAAFALFLLLIGLNLFGSYYAFEERAFLMKQLFFRKRVERELLYKLVIDEASGFAALYYFSPASPEALSYVPVNIRRRDLDSFTEALRRFKSDILIEVNPINQPSDPEK